MFSNTNEVSNLVTANYCGEQIVSDDKHKSLEFSGIKFQDELIDETLVYRTWPERLKCSPITGGVVASSASLTEVFSDTNSCDTRDKSQPKMTGMTNMDTALDGLSLSYSPVTRKLIQASEDDPVSRQEINIALEDLTVDENISNNDKAPEKKAATASRYVPCHRKAFSLPRTLEVVDENGSILEQHVEHDVEVESPRTTLQRYGLAYKPYNFDGEDVDSYAGSDLSDLTDYSERHFNCDTSSHGDSGIFSECNSGTSNIKQTKKGITDFLSKGLGTGWKSLSKSGQQMVKMMKKESLVPGEINDVPAPASPGTHLIMEPRPPGLPAKSTQEEARHRTQHNILIDQVKRREQTESRERARRLADQKRQEDDLSSLTSYWSNTVLPNWDSGVSNTKKTQCVWWRGLPPPVRGKVWIKALPNTLNLTPQLYNILVTRAHNQLLGVKRVGEEKAMSADSREETLELIKLDVSRTFPQLCIFQTGGPYYQLLHNVLGAFVCYRPDIGYVQGMSFLAAVLILNLDEAEAFIMFANLVNRPILAAFYSLNQQLMTQHYNSFYNMFAAHLPHLSAHFSNLGLRPDLYMLDWVMTMYSKTAPLDVACRIWDLLLRDGEKFLFRVAVGILSLYEKELLAEQDFVMIAQFLAKLPDSLEIDDLFDKIEEVGMTGVGSRTTVQQIIKMVTL